jgi:hypothetical protein
MESMTPLFPCKSIDGILEFYQALGFQVTYQQDTPYSYGAVCRGDINIHFTKNRGTSVCLVHVQDVGTYHKAFADGLRAKYGQVPTADVPRITRLKPGQTRFIVFDPVGNELVFINRDEPDIDYDAYPEGLSPLMDALENAIFLRDTYANDTAAAKFLDKKLKQPISAPPIELARVLAARAELAVALGDLTRADEIRAELRQIKLSDEERAQYQHELEAADKLERWLREAE